MLLRRCSIQAYPELYYFRAVDDEEDEAALFDVLCQAITVILYVLTADQSIVRYYKPFDGVGDYRRTVGKVSMSHSKAVHSRRSEILSSNNSAVPRSDDTRVGEICRRSC